MKTHAQLVWQSIFAPRAAVDLARQHPNPLQLGYIYLFAICVFAFVLEFARPALVQPLQPSEVGVDQSAYWLDHPLASGLFIVAFYIFNFIFAFWYWRAMASSEVGTSSVAAVIAVIFASELALYLPFDLLATLFENSSTPLFLLIILAPIAVALALSTMYVSYGLEMSKAKAFWLSVLFGSICVFFFIVVFAVLFAFESGTNIDGIIPQ